MFEYQRRVCVVGLFLLFYLPGGGLTLVLGILTVSDWPDLAALVCAGAGLLAFVLALGVAILPVVNGSGGEGNEPVLRLLDLRRNRGRYAFILSVAAAAPADLALRAASMLGLDAPVLSGAGAFLGVVTVLFALAWLLIGEAAGTPQALHRVLRRLKKAG